MAAELGWSLLGNNLELKAKRDALLQQQQQQAQERPLMRPSSSILARTDDTNTTASELLKHVEASSSRHSDTDSELGLHLIPKHETHQAIVRMLEIKNEEIETMVHKTELQRNLTQLDGAEKIESLQKQIRQLHASLESASETIEQLENEHKQRSQAIREYQRQSVSTRTTTKGEHVTDKNGDKYQLMKRMEALKAENSRLIFAKSVVEEKLAQASEELEHLRLQAAKYQSMMTQFDSKQTAYRQQLDYIATLSSTLEDYRNRLSHVRDKGVWLSDEEEEQQQQQQHAAASSSRGKRKGIMTTTPESTSGGRKSTSTARMKATKKRSQTNLMSELQRAWSKTDLRIDNNSKPSQTTNIVKDISSTTDKDNSATSNMSNASNPLTNTPGYHVKNILRATDEADVNNLSIRPSRRCRSSKGKSASSSAVYSSSTPCTDRLISTAAATISTADYEDVHQNIDNDGSDREAVTYPHLDGESICPYIPKLTFPQRYLRPYPLHGATTASSSSRHLPAQVRESRQRWIGFNAVEAAYRWTRFSLVLFLAVLINISQGPDAILEK